MRWDEQTEVLWNEWDGEEQTDWAVVPGVGWIQLPLTGRGSSEADQRARVNCTGVTCNWPWGFHRPGIKKKDVGRPGWMMDEKEQEVIPVLFLPYHVGNGPPALLKSHLVSLDQICLRQRDHEWGECLAPGGLPIPVFSELVSPLLSYYKWVDRYQGQQVKISDWNMCILARRLLAVQRSPAHSPSNFTAPEPHLWSA